MDASHGLPTAFRGLAAAALAAFLASPAPATQALGRNVSLKPLIEVIQANPSFRRELQAQAALLPQLAPASLGQASLAIPAVTAARGEALQAEALRVALGLAQPELLAAGGAELAQALGPEAIGALSQAAIADPESPLGRKLQSAREAVDLVHTGSLLALNERLTRLHDGSGMRPEETADPVAVGQGRREPLVSLQPSGGTDSRTLEAYLAQRTVITPRGLKRANFDSGDYRPEYDAFLKRKGYDVLVIKNPSRKETEDYREEDGFFLKSEYVRWVMPARPLEAYMADMEKGRGRKLQNEIDRSAHLVIERGPLTVEAFEEWYPIYEDEVVGKPGGKRNVARDFARKKLAEQGNLDTWHGVFYRDPATGAMLGGVIMKEWKERGMFVLGYAAYRPETKPFYMSVRTFVEGMRLALEHGYPVLSFGQDTNLFGYDYSLGLMENKSRFHLTPYPEDQVILLKVLDPSKFWSTAQHDGRRGGHFFFAMKRDSRAAQNYLKARDASEAPPEAQFLLSADESFTPTEETPHPPYFSSGIVLPRETLYGAHFYGDDVKISAPKSIDMVRRPMERTVDAPPPAP